MPITTIDQNNPQLQRYGSATVSGDLAAQLAQQQQNASMVGQDLFPGMQVPQEGDNLLEFLANLHFGGQSQLASDLAEMNGIPAQDFRSLVTEINTQTGSQPHGILGAISGIGNTVAENPALLFAAPLAIGALGGAFGGAAAGGAAGGAAGALPAAGYSGLGTLPAGIDIGATAIGSAGGIGGLGSLGIGAGAAGLASAGASGAAVPNGYSGLPSQPPGDYVTSIGQPAAAGGTGLGTGAGIGIGAGAGALLGAGLGGSSAAVPQGPPETQQGPPQDTQGGGTATGAGAGAGAGAGLAAGAGGLAGLTLPDWLTLAGVAGSALQGNQDQTTSRTNEPPAYLAPYLQQAAGAAQTQYGQGNYVAPVQQSAIDYGTNVLNGNYLNSNPYLDATFNKAAGAVTNAVQSNFGRAGRDVRGPDAAGIASGQYSDLAASIYGGNYQAERDRMQQIVPQANQLGAVTNPSQSLDDYIARLRNIGGNSGTATSTTPTQNNWWAGLAGLGLALQPGG